MQEVIAAPATPAPVPPSAFSRQTVREMREAKDAAAASASETAPAPAPGAPNGPGEDLLFFAWISNVPATPHVEDYIWVEWSNGASPEILASNALAEAVMKAPERRCLYFRHFGEAFAGRPAMMECSLEHMLLTGRLLIDAWRDAATRFWVEWDRLSRRFSAGPVDPGHVGFEAEFGPGWWWLGQTPEERGRRLWQLHQFARRISSNARVRSPVEAVEPAGPEALTAGNGLQPQAEAVAHYEAWAARVLASSLHAAAIEPCRQIVGWQPAWSIYGRCPSTRNGGRDLNNWPGIPVGRQRGQVGAPDVYLRDYGQRHNRLINHEARRAPRWHQFIDHLNALRAAVGVPMPYVGPALWQGDNRPPAASREGWRHLVRQIHAHGIRRAHLFDPHQTPQERAELEEFVTALGPVPRPREGLPWIEFDAEEVRTGDVVTPYREEEWL